MSWGRGGWGGGGEGGRGGMDLQSTHSTVGAGDLVKVEQYAKRHDREEGEDRDNQCHRHDVGVGDVKEWLNCRARHHSRFWKKHTVLLKIILIMNTSELRRLIVCGLRPAEKRCRRWT